MIRLYDLLKEAGVHWLSNKSDRNPFHIIDQNRDAIASQFAETITGVLNAGNNGFVYELASGKLMKITPDTKEVAAVIKLKRRPKMRHLISYYDVRNITNLVKNISWEGEAPEFEEDDRFYAIIMDRVTTLNNDQKDAWGIGQDHFLNVTGRMDVSNESFEEFLDEIGVELYPPASQISMTEFWRKVFPQRKNIIQEFKRAGINPYEAHQNNVGFDQFGQLVHFDPWIKMDTWGSPDINKTKLNKPVSIPTKYTTDGIDTPGDPNM